MTPLHVSSRSRMVALTLCFFGGFLGAHRFYVGKVGTAILMLVTLGGLGLWTLIDFILIGIGSFTDDRGRFLLTWGVESKPTRDDAIVTDALTPRLDRIDSELCELQSVLAKIDTRSGPVGVS